MRRFALPLRLVQVVGVLGFALDVWFHWRDDGPHAIVFDDTIEVGSAWWDIAPAAGNDWFDVGVAVAAHLCFIGAFLVFIFSPWLIRELRRDPEVEAETSPFRVDTTGRLTVHADAGFMPLAVRRDPPRSHAQRLRLVGQPPVPFLARALALYHVAKALK